jgi:hypothetical protein
VAVFAVISGGRDGAAYVRQLLRAADAGRLELDAIHVVDRDPACEAVRYARDPRVRLEAADWGEWLDGRLDALPAGSQLVPYHWAPHLLVDWLARQARRAGMRVLRGGEIPAQGVPYEATTGAGDRALSYATWVCPVMCIEPALCPHTRGPKDWSLCRQLETTQADDSFDARIVFRCLHLAWGVGTIPVAEILAARERMLAGVGSRPRRYLVATSSHCHALATSLTVSRA